MLYIKLPEGESTTWYTGERCPVAFADIKNVEEIQADGGELDLILRVCQNIPVVTTTNVMRWFGDDARFIVANVVKKYEKK